MNIDRKSELWGDFYSITNNTPMTDCLYLIATRHRDEAVEKVVEQYDTAVADARALAERYKADAERLEAKLAKTPWEVRDPDGGLIARYNTGYDARRCRDAHTIRNAITGKPIDAARAAEQESK